MLLLRRRDQDEGTIVQRKDGVEAGESGTPKGNGGGICTDFLSVLPSWEDDDLTRELKRMAGHPHYDEANIFASIVETRSIGEKGAD
jgi:hypothetical protein